MSVDSSTEGPRLSLACQMLGAAGCERYARGCGRDFLNRLFDVMRKRLGSILEDESNQAVEDRRTLRSVLRGSLVSPAALVTISVPRNENEAWMRTARRGEKASARGAPT